MMKEYRYLNDEELEALMAEVQRDHMIAPPSYLKDLIMEAAHGTEMKLSVPDEVSIKQLAPSRRMKAQIKNPDDRKAAAQRQFLLYSLKIVSAAAAAVFCLTMMPMNGPETFVNGEDRIEKQIDKDMERYEKEAQRLSAEEENRVEHFINGKSNEMFRFINQLWNLEDKDYD